MRILWVRTGGLLPLTSGGQIRSFHTIRELSEHHSVSVLTTHVPGLEEPGMAAAALPHCASARSIPHTPKPDWRTLVWPQRPTLENAAGIARSWPSALPVELWRWRVPALREAVRAALASGRFDACVADSLAAVPSVPAQNPVPVVLYEHNVEHLIWKRLAQSVAAWRRPALELEWRKLRRYERRACASATLTIAVSEHDRGTLASLAPSARVRAIATGVDLDYFAPNGRAERDANLVYVGSMDWYPNEDAALQLIEVILPLIRAEIPHATATIVGRDPSPRLQAAASRVGVRLTGTVADVRPYMADAAVLVTPLRIGGGTRLKLFEGLAMAKATVSTRIGAEGLPLVSGEHAVLVDGPSAFAAEVVALLRDPDRRRRLGLAGRELVASRYSWPQVVRRFEDHCLEAARVRR